MRIIVSLLTALVGTGLLLATGAQAQTTELVSVASDGTQGNLFSDDPAISADGRFVAFYSIASNLVAGDSNLVRDIFVHDRDSGTTERVSVASDGTQGNLGSFLPAISAGGRFVAFNAIASNLDPGDTNGFSDVFVHDREAPPQLALVGACPGSVSLSLTNATPDGLVVFGWGTTEGSVTLSPGSCAGTELGLAAPDLLGTLRADNSAAIAHDEDLGGDDCGLFVQALDLTTCQPSNVACLP